MSHQLNPPAATQAASTAAEKVAYAKHLEGEAKVHVGNAVANYRAIGKVLLEAKEQVGHGGWEEFLAEKWPDLPPRTARRWMRIHKTATVADLNAAIRAVTHAEDDEEGDVEDGPPADQGDASEDGDVAAPAPKPKLKREEQPRIDLEPAKTEAERKVAELRDHLEAASDLSREVLDGPAGKELRRLARLDGTPVGDDGQWPPLVNAFRAADKLARQGFEA